MPRLGLPPYPSGWFALCFGSELPRRGRRSCAWMGLDVELWRDPTGKARARTAHGQVLALDEQQGAILGWFHPAGADPTWRIPEPPRAEWTRFAGHRYRALESHPQETSENAVDVAHFASVHGYTDVATLAEATACGPVLSARYMFTRPLLRNGPAGLVANTEFTVDVHGLGFSFVETRIHNLGVRTRQLVMATPIDGHRMDLRISAAVGGLDGLGPLRGLARLAARMGLMQAYVADVTDDFEIWEHKRYLDRPVVVDGDGPIHRYRRWAKQFYVEDFEHAEAANA